MPCANCRKDLLKVGHEDSGEDEFILLGQPPGPSEAEDHSNENRKISIAASVGIIFEASLRLHKKQISASCRLKMCPNCLSSLSELHGSYLRFMGLATEGSYVQQLIETSVLWPFFGESKPGRGFSFTYDDVSPLVEVKLEEVEEVKAMVTTKEGKDDPDFVYEENLEEEGDDIDIHVSPFVRRSKRRTTSIKSVKSLGLKNAVIKLTPVSSDRTQSVTRFTSKRKASVSPHSRTKPKTRKPRAVKTQVKPDAENPGKPLKCPEADCTKSFNSGKLLRRHVKFKHGGASPEELLPRTCNHCPKPKIFCTPSQLRSHQQEVHATETPFECPKCDRRFPTKNRLRIHTLVKHAPTSTSQTQTEKEPLLCPHNCSTPFRSKVSLQLHLKSVHNEDVIYACATCGRTFRRSTRYRRHLKYQHGEGLTTSDLEGRTCTICSRVFETKSQLKCHAEGVHAKDKPFECEYEGCGKKFPSKNYLNIHRHMRHKREPVKYPCEQCGKSYFTKPSLQEHIDITHLGQKNIICEICGKAFARPNILNRHMETHDTTRHRQFECPVCKQLFISERTLKSHAITHSGVRDQCCTHCGQTFLHVGSLRRHLHAKHGVNMATRGADAKKGHTCGQCGKTFKLREYLSQHLRSRTHGGKGHTGQRKREANKQAETEEVSLVIGTKTKITGDEVQTVERLGGDGAGQGQPKLELLQGHPALFWTQASIPPPGSSPYFNH